MSLLGSFLLANMIEGANAQRRTPRYKPEPSEAERRIRERIAALDAQIAQTDAKIRKLEAIVAHPREVLLKCKKDLRAQGCREPLTIIDDCVALEDPTEEEARGALDALSELFKERLEKLPYSANARWYDDTPIKVALSKLQTNQS